MMQSDINMEVCYSMDCGGQVFAKSIWPHSAALEHGLLLPWCVVCWEEFRHKGQFAVFEFTEDDFWKELND